MVLLFLKMIFLFYLYYLFHNRKHNHVIHHIFLSLDYLLYIHYNNRLIYIRYYYALLIFFCLFFKITIIYNFFFIFRYRKIYFVFSVFIFNIDDYCILLSFLCGWYIFKTTGVEFIIFHFLFFKK